MLKDHFFQTWTFRNYTMSNVPNPAQPDPPSLRDRFTQPALAEFERNVADFQLDLYKEANAACANRKEGVDPKISPDDLSRSLPKLHYRYVLGHRKKLIGWKIGTLAFSLFGGYFINQASSLSDRIRALAGNTDVKAVENVANGGGTILVLAILFSVLGIVCAAIDYNSEVQP